MPLRFPDPTRPMVTLKTSWSSIRATANVKGRWHDNRHTLITDLAESGAGDETIRDIAGHVSRKTLSHYSHIRMQAKRNALEAILPKQANRSTASIQTAPNTNMQSAPEAEKRLAQEIHVKESPKWSEKIILYAENGTGSC